MIAEIIERDPKCHGCLNSFLPELESYGPRVYLPSFPVGDTLPARAFDLNSNALPARVFDYCQIGMLVGAEWYSSRFENNGFSVMRS